MNVAASAGVLPRWQGEPLPGSKESVSWRWSAVGGRSALLVTSSARDEAGLAPLTLAVPAITDAFASELSPSAPEAARQALSGACRELLAVQLREWSAKALDARWRPRELAEESLDSPAVAERVEAVLAPAEAVASVELAALPPLPEVVGVRSVSLEGFGLPAALLAASQSTIDRGGLVCVAVIALAVGDGVRRQLVDLGDVDSVAAFCEQVAASRGVTWPVVAGALLGGAAALGLEVRPRG